MRYTPFIVCLFFFGCQNADKEASDGLARETKVLEDLHNLRTTFNAALQRQSDQNEIIIVAQKEILLDNRIMDALQSGDMKLFKQMIPERNALNNDLVRKLNVVYK